ncbi:MAG: hypothetical protein II603_02995 [Muribaculaceae bacterium]|nr:hypothetical protein [Muribaculaceae bacterium]
MPQPITAAAVGALDESDNGGGNGSCHIGGQRNKLDEGQSATVLPITGCAGWGGGTTKQAPT